LIKRLLRADLWKYGLTVFQMDRHTWVTVYANGVLAAFDTTTALN